ncbi:MAG: glycosyltransferase family 39 protein [Candidatus Omnitrophica bacterium]|jgi:4-amino-4-deoxy-L-arabinose transferase-like glycosyltransferase|nr:glycosyltransferase family 39 protein [Candidatus Omnitrophota bacterium]
MKINRLNFFKTLLIPVIISLSTVLFFSGNDKLTFFERSEPRFAQTAREMLETGDYVVPRFNSQYHFKKPAFFYWLLTISYRIFGINEFSARFWPALFGVANCLLIFFLAKLLFDKTTAFISALIFMTSSQVYINAKFCTTDNILLFFITAALFSFYFIYQKGKSRIAHLIFYASLSLSVLTKGPVGLVIVLFTIFIFIIYSKKKSVVKDLQIVKGLLIFILITFPWLILVYLKTDGLFFKVAIGHEFIERCFKTFQHHSGSPIYYLKVLLIRFFPWICFLPLVLVRILRDRNIVLPQIKLLLIWAIVPIVLFTFIATKLPHYVLPLYPPMVLLMGFFFKDIIDNKTFLWKGFTGKISLSLYILLSVFIIVFLPIIFYKLSLSRIVMPAIFISAILLFSLMIGLVFFTLKNNIFGFIAIFLGIYLGLALIPFLVYPVFNKYNVSKPLADIVNNYHQAGDIKAVYSFREPNLIFYLKGNVLILKKKEQLASLLSGQSKFYCILPYKDYLNFEKEKNLLLLDRKERYIASLHRWVDLCVVTNDKIF